MMRRHRSALFALVLGACVVSGCQRRDEEAAAVVDTELMAYLSEARALHHQANLKEEGNDLPGATDAIRRLVAAARPHGGKPIPEVEEVLADAYARLGELELRQGALTPASEAIEAGLAHAPKPTYFRGRLLEVEGLIEETRATSLADAGKLADAVHAREHAIELLEEVVRIQDDVIKRTISNRDAGGAHR
jgi:hypothetical protein